MCIRERSERPEEWVPVQTASYGEVPGDCSGTLNVAVENRREIVDIFSIHSGDGTGNFEKQYISFRR